MKNRIKFFGIVALVAAIGFTMAACSDAVEEDSSTKGTIRIQMPSFVFLNKPLES